MVLMYIHICKQSHYEGKGSHVLLLHWLVASMSWVRLLSSCFFSMSISNPL